MATNNSRAGMAGVAARNQGRSSLPTGSGAPDPSYLFDGSGTSGARVGVPRGTALGSIPSYSMPPPDLPDSGPITGTTAPPVVNEIIATATPGPNPSPSQAASPPTANASSTFEFAGYRDGRPMQRDPATGEIIPILRAQPATLWDLPPGDVQMASTFGTARTRVGETPEQRARGDRNWQMAGGGFGSMAAVGQRARGTGDFSRSPGSMSTGISNGPDNELTGSQEIRGYVDENTGTVRDPRAQQRGIVPRSIAKSNNREWNSMWGR